ncbi:MAG: ABC transporter permease [Vicinamibacterales bacterium]
MSLLNDLRLAVRSLTAHRTFTAAVIMTLALSIGANTSVFAVVNAVLLRTLPVNVPDELVMFYWLRLADPTVDGYSGYGRPGPNGAGVRTSFSILTLERFRDQSSTLAQVFAIAPLREAGLSADGQTDAVTADLVSGSYFAGLGVQAGRGRVLTGADDRIEAEPVAVISHRYWQRRFDGDPAILGKAIQVNRVPVTIVGVTPEGFEGVRMTQTTDVTMPMAMASRLESGTTRPVSMWWVQIMARLKPGVRREQALADVERLFDQSARESWAARPTSSTKPGTSEPRLGIMSGSQGTEASRRDAMPVLTAMAGVTIGVLLIACVNIANLMLVRTLDRRQEIALRVSLGASRGRVLRHLLTESVVLALAGAALGIVFAFWGRNFLAWLPATSSAIVDAKIDWRAIAFATSLGGVTAILCGLAPALRATRMDLILSMKAVALPRRGVVRRLLVAAQVTLSLVMLAAAAAFLQTLYNLARVDVGFVTDNLLLARISSAGPAADSRLTFQLYDEVLDKVRQVPGVRGATMSAVPPLAQAEWSAMVSADPATPGTDVYIQVVAPDFFQTMEIPMERGRDLSPSDREGAPRVAVVNEAMARTVFGSTDPIGREFQMLGDADRGVGVHVVGVVRNAAYARLQEAAPPTLYMPHRQLSPAPMTLEIRTAADPMTLVPAIRQAITRVDRSIVVSAVKSQAEQIQQTIARPRAFAAVTGACSIVGLALACLGLYGIVSFDVTRRTREIGIRMALGARQSEVIRFMLRDLALVVLIGVALGAVLSIAVTSAARGMFFGVAAGSPLATVVGVVVLTLAAGVAGYLPARRAASIDPTRALRDQ